MIYKRFEVQEVLTQLNALAHNIVIWFRGWLAPAYSCLRVFGVLRMVRGVFQVSGVAAWQSGDHLCQITLYAGTEDGVWLFTTRHFSRVAHAKH